MATRTTQDGKLTATDKPGAAAEVAGHDQLPRDKHGRPLKGGARDAYVQRQAEVQAAVDARELMESLAAAVMVLASSSPACPARTRCGHS